MNPVGHQMKSSLLLEATYKKDTIKTQHELGEVQKSLLHSPFNGALAQEQARPDSTLNWITGEQYV